MSCSKLKWNSYPVLLSFVWFLANVNPWQKLFPSGIFLHSFLNSTVLIALKNRFFNLNLKKSASTLEYVVVNEKSNQSHTKVMLNQKQLGHPPICQISVRTFYQEETVVTINKSIISIHMKLSWWDFFWKRYLYNTILRNTLLRNRCASYQFPSKINLFTFSTFLRSNWYF